MRRLHRALRARGRQLVLAHLASAARRRVSGAASAWRRRVSGRPVRALSLQQVISGGGEEGSSWQSRRALRMARPGSNVGQAGGMKSSESGDQAPGNGGAPAVPGQGQAAAGGAQAPGAGDWAICCSGGGIRSAAYCLGALQSLDQRGLLPKAKWILGVSGGSYITTSPPPLTPDLLPRTDPHPYAPLTPQS